jgi:membrane associated rhomboid family serine protease
MSKTNWLLILCILISSTNWIVGNQQFTDYLVFSGDNLIQGRIWTLFTGLFLHSDLLHLLGNMIFLYIFGNTIENELDSTWVTIPFFVGGITTFILSQFFYSSEVQMLGASAAIFTLTAIVMLLKPLKFSFIFLMPLGLVAVIYFFFNILSLYSGSQSNISYIGHIIGFLTGIPFGIAGSEDWSKNMIITAILFGIYLVVVYFLYPTLTSLL